MFYRILDAMMGWMTRQSVGSLFFWLLVYISACLLIEAAVS